MRILIAEDEIVSRSILEQTLRMWGHEYISAADGRFAWEVLARADPPRLALIDWMMPGMEGPEVCRRARALGRPVPTYTILLTAKDDPEDIVCGLDSGADDYVTKPFNRAELQSRIRVGERVVELQENLDPIPEPLQHGR